MNNNFFLLRKESLWGAAFWYAVPKASAQVKNADTAASKTNLFGGSNDSSLQNNK